MSRRVVAAAATCATQIERINAHGERRREGESGHRIISLFIWLLCVIVAKLSREKEQTSKILYCTRTTRPNRSLATEEDDRKERQK